MKQAPPQPTWCPVNSAGRARWERNVHRLRPAKPARALSTVWAASLASGPSPTRPPMYVAAPLCDVGRREGRMPLTCTDAPKRPHGT